MTDFVRSEFFFGPDNIIPSSSFYASKLDECVKLRKDTSVLNLTNNTAITPYQPVSIFTQFKRIVNEGPNHIALVSENENGIWTSLTYEAYWNLCISAAKSFIKLGLKANQCVAIIGFNAPEWMIALYGTIFSCGIGCGIYTTNSSEACEYVMKDSNARIVVVENQVHLDKFLKIKKNCQIEAIIQYKDQVKDSHNGLVMSWSDFIQHGKNVADEELENRIQQIAPNKCATLIYTSGTTGHPKAVMLSHDNVTYTAKYLVEITNSFKFKERIISYLPLSHIAGQMLDVYSATFLGSTVFFANPDVFKGTLTKTLNHAKPTIFLAVPRVWEKLQEKITENVAGLSKTKAQLFNWASKSKFDHIQAKLENKSYKTLQSYIADKLVLNKIRCLLGLHETRLLLSGAAPLSRKTLDFFIGLGMQITDMFGMSETGGPHTICVPEKNRIGSVGFLHQFNATKIFNPDKFGEGELCLFGRNLFMGYLNSAIKTQESMDTDGYLHSGDLGKIDSDGFVYITGRIKEIIITAGGENVAPVPIEEAIKEELADILSNCMVIGDKRKYLTILITLKCKMDMVTLEYTDDLTDECLKALRFKCGSNATKSSQIVQNKQDPTYELIGKAIRSANKKAVSNVATVKKFTIIQKDFSIVTGELSSTFKLKRSAIASKYANLIEALYSDEKNDWGQ